MSHEASSSGEIFIGLLPPSPLQIDIASFEIKKGRREGGGIAKAQFENLRLKYPVRRSTFYNEISYPLFLFFFLL